jgi:hypothetical protein
MKQPTLIHGPGFHRMKTRLGVEGSEALRQQVIRDQAAALALVARPPANKQDHTTYKIYPKSKRRE